MTDKPITSPIALPPGAFELSDLQDLGDRASKASADDRPALIADGLAEINRREDHADEPGHLPGHRYETVERVLAEGTEEAVEGSKKGETRIVGEVRVQERIQIFDRKLADEELAAAAGPAASASPAAAAASSAATAADTRSAAESAAAPAA